jgi:hypothetical protein
MEWDGTMEWLVDSRWTISVYASEVQGQRLVPIKEMNQINLSSILALRRRTRCDEQTVLNSVFDKYTVTV